MSTLSEQPSALHSTLIPYYRLLCVFFIVRARVCRLSCVSLLGRELCVGKDYICPVLWYIQCLVHRTHLLMNEWSRWLPVPNSVADQTRSYTGMLSTVNFPRFLYSLAEDWFGGRCVCRMLILLRKILTRQQAFTARARQCAKCRVNAQVNDAESLSLQRSRNICKQMAFIQGKRNKY